jgi:hypothetical protein
VALKTRQSDQQYNFLTHGPSRCCPSGFGTFAQRRRRLLATLPDRRDPRSPTTASAEQAAQQKTDHPAAPLGDSDGGGGTTGPSQTSTSTRTRGLPRISGQYPSNTSKRRHVCCQPRTQPPAHLPTCPSTSQLHFHPPNISYHQK